jgi:hypothetical protein
MKTQVDARPRGLRLTIRHQMILVAYFALVFMIFNAQQGKVGAIGWEDGTLWTVLLSPWILGGLVMLLDQPGPIRNWAVSGLLMTFSPALVIQHDYYALKGLLETGRMAHPLQSLLFNAFFLGSFAVYWYHMGIARCPQCARRALIPLMRLWGQAPRTSKTRWCASCGALLWKHADGSWRKERRRTWLDDVRETAAEEPSVDAPVSSPTTAAITAGLEPKPNAG